MNSKIKTIRLTEDELVSMVDNTANRIIRESRVENEIKLAQQELYKMGSNLSSVGSRLNNTQFHKQFLRMWDELVNLNNALNDFLRKSK